MDFIKDFTVADEEKCQKKITGEIPFEELKQHRAAAVKALGKNIEVSGFRKGNVPEDMIVEKIGEINIMTEMAERALAKVYPEAVKHFEIQAIGHPQIQITKIAPENPLGFTATVAVMPEITLPDYKALATEANKDKASDEVTDADVDKQAEDIMRQKIAYERMQEKATTKAAAEAAAPDTGDLTASNAQAGATELPTPESETAKAAETEEDIDPAKIELPELTDEYVKTLGEPGQFETVADFKAKLKEHLGIEKKREVTAAHRAKVTDKIIEGSTFELPQIMVDSEINQMFGQMNEDITKAGLNMEEYLGHIKKTKEDLVEEWKPAAEKRARLQLVLNEIAKVEEVKPDQKALDDQVAQLKEQYKDADENRVRVYVHSVMQNESVMQLLENY